MILSPAICGILTNVRRISFSKRCMLWTYTCRSNSCTNGSVQNIGSRRSCHGRLNNLQMISSKESFYQQKDNLSRDYKLIYFHPEQNQWSIIYYCIQFMQIAVIVIVTFGYFNFMPPQERGEGPMWKRKDKRIEDRYEFIVMGVTCILTLFLLSRGLACTVSRMYSNSKKCEYKIIFLKHIFDRSITIPYNCFTPKYNIPFFLGREILFTANKHTLVLFNEHFQSPYVARNVLINKM